MNTVLSTVGFKNGQQTQTCSVHKEHTQMVADPGSSAGDLYRDRIFDRPARGHYRHGLSRVIYHHCPDHVSRKAQDAGAGTRALRRQLQQRSEKARPGTGDPLRDP